jgi:hypothetical protein
MTKVGKVLVFFNLIFSVVVGAFVVMVYISQTHWAHDYADLQHQYEVAQAQVAQYQKEAQAASDYTSELDKKVLSDAQVAKMIGATGGEDVTAKLKKYKDTLTAALADAKEKDDANEQLKKDLSTARKQMQGLDVSLRSGQSEVETRQTESDATKKQLADEQKKNVDLVKEKNQEHDQMVAWKIRAESAELRRNELEKENDRLARDNQKMIANGGTLTTAMKKEGPNPPLDNVEGLISEVTESGLVRITIGSDAGLSNGNTLEVYRLNTLTPDQSKYLGRIKIIKVSATEAVAQPMGKLLAPLQPNDTVSSRIVGS